jgi:hypothetical protein
VTTDRDPTHDHWTEGMFVSAFWRLSGCGSQKLKQRPSL